MFNKRYILFRKINPKIFFSVGGIIIVSAFIKLFIFSTHEESDESYQQYFSQNYKIFALNIPKDLNFSGEKTPVENFYVRENLDRELLVNTYFQSQTLLYLKRANRWFPVIEPILKKNNIPEDFKYLALIESGFSNVVSPRGATGFWQIMKDAGIQYGLEINDEVDERYNLEKSTDAACKYLNEAYRKFNNWTLAAASYNMGIEGLARQIEKQKNNSYYDLLLNDETSRYIFRILVVKEIMQNPKKYGFLIRKKDLYPPIGTISIDVDSTVPDLADFAAQHGINYKTLKIFNPWLRETRLNINNDKKYLLKIPTEEFKNLPLVFDTEYFGNSNAYPDSVNHSLYIDSIPSTLDSPGKPGDSVAVPSPKMSD